MASSRSARRTLRRRMAIGVLVVAALLAAIFVARARWPERSDRAGSDAAIARALGELQTGNPSAAVAAAHEAVLADPAHGLAHAVLARTLLALDDGVGAAAALDRAAKAGFDMRRVAQLRAHASYLQGDAEAALAEVGRSHPRYAVYADRIRALALADQGDTDRARALLDAATAARPGDWAGWVALARFRQDIGDEGGAIAASERAIAADRRQVDTLRLRGEMVRSQFGPVAALPWFEQAAARDPRHFGALIAYAATLGDIGRTREMLATVRRAEAVRPGDPQALYLQAVLAARAGRFALAESVVQRLGGAGESMPGVLLLKGVVDIKAGRLEQAIATLRSLIDRQPRNFTARRLLAAALARSDASRAAIDALRPVIERSDADSYALVTAARAFERIGERDPAAGLLDRAAVPARGGSGAFVGGTNLSAALASARRARGAAGPTIAYVRAMVRSGDLEGALAEARALAGRYPGLPAAHIAIGDVAMLARQPTPAAQAFARAASLRFDEPAMLRLVEAQDAAGQRGEAANTLALFVSQHPGNLAALRLSAAWQLAGGEPGSAIDSFAAIRAVAGNRDAAVLLGSATAHLAIGETDRALEFARDAYALQPQNPMVADAYGEALRASGDRQGAVQLLRKAAAIAPGHPGIAAHLTQAIAELRAS
ncbi:tetratricopeptide repeat protein [Sphingomonas qomolangmaensis]|uniref:Tetratricopeptide repeat protein n=1 Tax=Sphingomonas qomolangmaensis TaxID=2918765 RepID=A0ABY5LAA4_9SPHN|nr:tetratricopeptide repeat protein [Sphingomonas qomolangmaensis]UUL82973.1 tetratricopeptide repeat protein [Sphingomonas qomolangmaensis]